MENSAYLLNEGFRNDSLKEHYKRNMFVLVIPFFLFLQNMYWILPAFILFLKSNKYQKTYWSLTYIMLLVFFIPHENIRKSDILYVFRGYRRRLVLLCGLTVKAWCVWNHSNYSLIQIRLNGNFGSESDVAIYSGVLPKSKSFSPDFAPHIHCTKNEVFH